MAVEKKQIAAWQAETKKLNDERAALLKAAAARTPQGFNDTERARLEQIRGEIESKAELITAAQDAIEADRAQLTRTIEEAPARTGRESVFDPVLEERPSGVRMNPFGTRPNPFEPDPLLHGPIRVGGEVFRGLGDWLQAEAYTAISRVKPEQRAEGDPRILRLMRTTGVSGTGAGDREARLAGEGVDIAVPATGGAFLQSQVMARLLQRAWGEGTILSRCTSIPVSAPYDGLYMPTLEENDRTRGKRWGGIQLYWQGDPVPDVNPNVEPREIKLRELRGYILIDEKTLRDAAALGAYFLSNFPRAFVWEAEDMILRGAGNGRPVGILDAANAGKVVVDKEGGQAAATVVAKNLVKLRGGSLDPRNAAFYVNAEVDEQLMLAYLPTGANSGQLVYMPPTGMSTEPYGTIFGRPVIPIEQASGLGDLGDIGLYDFLDYLIALRDNGLETGTSLEFAFDVWKRAFRFRMEFNGQPVYSKPIKPAYGTKQRSPFAILAERK